MHTGYGTTPANFSNYHRLPPPLAMSPPGTAAGGGGGDGGGWGTLPADITRYVSGAGPAVGCRVIPTAPPCTLRQGGDAV